MKKIGIILVAIMFIFSLSSPVLAHPGKTDKKGCHICKTNCKKWGLKYNQYHCHRAK